MTADGAFFVCKNNKKDRFKGGLLVGVVRLERTTTCTPCKYASQLRYTPIAWCHPFQMTMQR